MRAQVVGSLGTSCSRRDGGGGRRCLVAWRAPDCRVGAVMWCAFGVFYLVDCALCVVIWRRVSGGVGRGGLYCTDCTENGRGRGERTSKVDMQCDVLFLFFIIIVLFLFSFSPLKNETVAHEKQKMFCMAVLGDVFWRRVCGDDDREQQTI